MPALGVADQRVGEALDGRHRTLAADAVDHDDRLPPPAVVPHLVGNEVGRGEKRVPRVPQRGCVAPVTAVIKDRYLAIVSALVKLNNGATPGGNRQLDGGIV